MELIDASTDSLTVTWPATEHAIRYVLEYRTEEQEEFQVLSNKLTQTQARKRNLSGPQGFYFRAGAIVGGSGSSSSTYDDDEEDVQVDQSSWVSNEQQQQPFYLLTKKEEKLQMEAPTVTDAYSNLAVMVSWKASSSSSHAKNQRPSTTNTKCYELQMRENRGGEPWTTIAASLTSLEVKKKNLSSALGYQFRVRPATEQKNDDDDDDDDNNNDNRLPFSPPSTPIIAKGLSPALKRWFHGLEQGTLIKNGGTGKMKEAVTSTYLADALGGKEFILLYASAHWCGPCRQFTPKLVKWYHDSFPTASPRPVEVVFVSCDHDLEGFQQYFWAYKQPWFAVDFDDVAREQLLAAISVTGIPRLVVIHGETGRILVENAIGQSLDILKWRQLAAAATAAEGPASRSSSSRTSFAGTPSSSSAAKSPVGRKSSVF
jgi:thiol-disulfide isomerase/thioredoxin